MKKFLLLFIFGSIVSFASAQQPSVCVITNGGSSGTACTATTLGPVNPCGTIPFILTDYLPVPSGYNTVGKYEWYVNGTLTKTSTDPTDYGFNYVVLVKSVSVYCKVTYKKLDGSLSSAFTSNTFTPTIKDLNFDLITTSTPPANYGCTTGTVSFSLNTFTCSGPPALCDNILNVTQYNITWQAPSGWTQTSISTNGNNVSFTPDATSAGLLTATIHLPCGYIDTRTFNISRTAQAPTFTASNVTSCTSTASVSINPTCGASDYTYTITGNAGVTFTSNGLQTLTSSGTTANISIAGGSSANTIKVKANYPGSIQSAEASSTLTAGTPAPDPISVLLVDAAIGKIQVEIPAVPGATDYSWYKDGVLQTAYHSTFAQISITKNVCNVRYNISVKATTACGISALTSKSVYVPCDNFFVFSPNPANSDVTISIDQSKSQSTNITFDEARIYDVHGILKKYKTFNKAKTGTISVSEFGTGIYFIEMVNGSYTERHQLLIQK